MNSPLQEYFSLPSNSREIHPPPCNWGEQDDCRLVQAPQQAPSVWPRQFRQKELSEPWGFCSHYPRCTQAISKPLLRTQTGWLESVSGRAAADAPPPRMLSAPQGHAVLPAGNRVPANTAPTELRRHGFLPTRHRADSSWTFSSCLGEKSAAFYFPTSHLATEKHP